ncbi:MAG: EscU/YscU/HrcU family type III secretion system export apparatus switch protein, partial [Oscillospiraceae bacterium]
MAGGSAESKTEKATPKRRKDERKKGNVFKSNDVNAVASLFVVFMLLKIYLPFMLKAFKKTIELAIASTNEFVFLETADYINILGRSLGSYAACAAPILVCGGFISILMTGAQTRFLISGESIRFKFSKLNPIEGIKKMFSFRSIFELIKASAKITIIGIVVYQSFKGLVPTYPRYMDMSILSSVEIILTDILNIVIRIGAVFLFIAAFDYGYSWWEYEKKMKMGKQELKEEYKQTEGDPQVKGKIKEKQRAVAMNRMMQKVPEADVVIRNPTHVAVALKYNPETSDAPIVVAKGID